MIKRVVIVLCSLCVFLAFSAQPGVAAEHPRRPYGIAVEQWSRNFDAVAREIERGEITQGRATELKKDLGAIGAEAKQIKADAQRELGPLKDQLQALGPAPAEGEPAETGEIAAQRKKLQDDIADYQARIKQADLTLARIQDLTLQINEQTLERSIALLTTAYPIPVAPTTVPTAVPELFVVLARLGKAPVEWWQSLTDAVHISVLTRIAIFLIPALILAWLIRRALVRYFGRDPAIQHPTYSRRLVAAIVEGLARGIVPSFILAAIIVRAKSAGSPFSGLMEDIVVVACGVTIMFILALALPRAVFSPDLPNWRLIPFSAEHAKIIDRRIAYLAAVFAVDLFLVVSTKSLSVSDSLYSFYIFAAKLLEAFCVIALLPQGLWVWDSDDADTKAEAEADATSRDKLKSRFWPALRLVALVLAVASVLSALFGYANFSRYLMDNLVISGMAIGVLFLTRGFLREIIGMVLRSRFVQVQLGLPHKSRQRYKFWLRAILDLSIYLGGTVVVMIVWGVPPTEIYHWVRGALQEFTIGNVTISLGDVMVAILIFFAAMTVTRALQRTLTDRVFPETDLDIGVQNSLSSGFGYVGLAIAVILAISAIGLDLSNIALIAGALSVGIGFGLQAIINNFVSGLIILIERPIKVGDWIIAGGYEGTVKRINVRATEIETFQRAAIIIPNSELITGAVTNWTHKDRFGRVEVPVGVAYGSDVQKVMSILTACMQDHGDILAWPEPYVLFRNFGESSLDFEARGFIGNVERRIIVHSELNIAIERALREASIEIPFPQRDLHIRSAAGLELEARQRSAAASTDSKPAADRDG